MKDISLEELEQQIIEIAYQQLINEKKESDAAAVREIVSIVRKNYDI